MKKFLSYFVIMACCNSNIAFGACEKNQTPSTPTSRFTLKEGEAFDKKTNLPWNRCSVGTTWKNGKCVGTVEFMSLSEAKKYAHQLGGGWRIPTVDELYGIVEHSCNKPFINSEVFPGVKDFGEGAPYWSATTIKEMPFFIYYIDFFYGGADGHTKDFSLAVRLVRGQK
jgi:hypothetical protein